MNNQPAMYNNTSSFGAGDSPDLANMPANTAQWLQQDLDYGFDDPDQDLDGDGYADDGGPEGRDAKRRRIARACDMCRKKKIKCDGKTPKCSHCENYKTECVFTHVEKKRAPPKGAKYIEGLENRLGRMESLLRLSGLLAEDDGGRTDLGMLERRLAERQTSMASPASQPSNHNSAKDGSTPVEPSDSHNPNSLNGSNQTNGDSLSPAALLSREKRDSIKEGGGQVDALADQMCSLITNNCGETRYIGSSSGFSIFSPKGIQWVNEKTGDSGFQSMIAAATDERSGGWDHWKPEVFNDLFQRRVFRPLPSRQECNALLKDYFENFNCMFPLFHEPTFMHLVDRHYSLEPYEGSGWWASLNVALAIAHRLRVMSNVVASDEDDVAWAYLKNAMAVVTELTMRNTDLLSVQALLGMALFLQGTPNPQPSFFLIAAAIRLAHSIGLHKRGSGFNLNEIENEQRKRVFWIAYLMDKDICLRSGRPPAQDDDDMNVELPSENPPDNIGNIPLAQEKDGKRTMNLFRHMCTFAQIQSQVYKQLYSVKAGRQSDGELLNTIGELDAQLEGWKDSIPLDFRPEHEIKAAHTPLILHVVVLHFAYYNCLTTIHRMSVHHGYWTSRLSDYAIQGLNARPLNPRVFMSAALCVNAARTSIGLIRYIPQGDYACVWLILYYPVSALVTLFANILQNPQDARARSDLKLMASVVSFLNMLERDITENGGNVRRTLAICAEFERIARVALDKAEREMRGRGKRKQAEREREKALKDPGSGEVSTGLEEGKTLEQMQVETQAAYRRPVQTPSLNMASGSQAGSSPASWASPPGGAGAEYRTPQPPNLTIPGQLQPQSASQSSNQPSNAYSQQNAQVNNRRHSSAQTPQQSFAVPSQSPNFLSTSAQPIGTTQYPFGTSSYSHQPPHQAFTTDDPDPASGRGSVNINPPPFPVPQTPSSFSPHMDLGGAFSAFDPSHLGAFAPISGGGGANTGSPSSSNAFQQPFVPQDLWQMPMTFEWDWAEGLGGLGNFGGGGNAFNTAAAAAASNPGYVPTGSNIFDPMSSTAAASGPSGGGGLENTGVAPGFENERVGGR